PELILFQEEDIDGTRSYHVEERNPLLSQTLTTDNTSRNYTFAQNYDSPYLYYQILEPHGKNKSGKLTDSNIKI
ncbi:endonuclease/exonuclease/phosphatase family protein, partial [[Ruminococcus] gnavus]|nr:endonuclease/exonuclease/phosphatase family protein [Mediterraneibacter gnavus]